MAWKLEEDGKLASVDNKPVCVNDEGEEKAFDYMAKNEPDAQKSFE